MRVITVFGRHRCCFKIQRKVMSRLLATGAPDSTVVTLLCNPALKILGLDS